MSKYTRIRAHNIYCGGYLSKKKDKSTSKVKRFDCKSNEKRNITQDINLNQLKLTLYKGNASKICQDPTYLLLYYYILEITQKNNIFYNNYQNKNKLIKKRTPKKCISFVRLLTYVLRRYLLENINPVHYLLLTN